MPATPPVALATGASCGIGNAATFALSGAIGHLAAAIYTQRRRIIYDAVAESMRAATIPPPSPG